MIVFLIIILSRICVSFVRSDPPPGVICVYASSDNGFNFKINVADVPDRCKVVIYGEYDFNESLDAPDIATIKALMSSGKTVYMTFNCPEPEDLAKVINDPKKLDAFIAPMLAFLKENNKIGGVILGYLNAYSGTIQNYATKITTIICKIKEIAPSVKIGLLLDAIDSPYYKFTKEFDFTVTNDHVDLYVINLWSLVVDCAPNLSAAGGRIPIHTDSADIISLEKLCKNIDSSSIDKSKIVANTVDGATLLDKSGTKTTINPYSMYCSGQASTGEVWCPDSIKILYDQVTFLKNTFKGIVITFMDCDDSTSTCGCGKFPVANTQIDAFEGKAMKPCDKIG